MNARWRQYVKRRNFLLNTAFPPFSVLQMNLCHTGLQIPDNRDDGFLKI